MAPISKLAFSAFSVLTLFSLATRADKTVTLDLIDESAKFHQGDLVRRQSGEGWRSTDIIYNSTEYQFYVDVGIGDKNKNLRLGVIQNPFTWVASRWNSTHDCPPLTQTYACGRIRGSGFFSLDPPDSSTYRNLSDDFDILYSDNRYSIGTWGRDKFRLGQLTIDDVNFGVGEFYNATPALGLERSDSTTKYPTFLEVMQDQGIINTATYGIYVGDIRGREDSGKSITFGGIDTAKFGRPLRTFSSQTTYALDLLSVGIVSQGNVVSTPLDQPINSPLVAHLNFGTASIHLPSDAFDVVMDDLGAKPSNNYDILTLPPEGSGLNFTFSGGFSIFVPYSQMISANPDSAWYTVLVVPNNRNTILGTPFFRSAYVFYDFQNEEFSIAPALFNVTASNVTEVGVDNASVSVYEWLYVDDTPALIPSPSPSPSPPTDPVNKDSGGSSVPVGAIAGGAAGGAVLIGIIIGVCVYIFYYRPRHPRFQNDDLYNGGGQMTQAPAHMPLPPPGPAPGPPPGPGVFTNEQFSPTKPMYSPPVGSPVGSPVSELSPNPWNRPENAAPAPYMHNQGVQRNPNIHEMMG
ncbi:hypothetical protein TWF730_009347 [Orbilia blumenaviensis]|uniref:Peptidase A1 domain-containing protein n=1 Tax=Orbilia blumenaviensis TaxID=1796055 RepID=A0AAV9UZL2_9PEZI